MSVPDDPHRAAAGTTRTAAPAGPDVAIAVRLLAYGAAMLQALDDPTTPAADRAGANDGVRAQVTRATAAACGLAQLILEHGGQPAGRIERAADDVVGTFTSLVDAVARYPAVAREARALAATAARAGDAAQGGQPAGRAAAGRRGETTPRRRGQPWWGGDPASAPAPPNRNE